MSTIASPKPQYPPCNLAAVAFRQLVSAWNADTTSMQVDVAAAELATAVARQGGTVRVAIWRADRVRLHGLALFLDQYGVILRQKRRGDGYVFIFAEIAQVAPSAFEGAVVTEKAVRVAA